MAEASSDNGLETAKALLWPTGDGRWSKLGRPAKGVILFGSVIMGLIYVGVGIAVWEGRDAVLDDTKRELITLNTVLAEETARTLDGVKLVVDGITERIQEEGLDTPSKFAEAMDDVVISKMLLERSSGMPQIAAVTILSDNGDLINFSREQPLPRINAADRSYFHVLRDDPARTYFLSEPIINRIDGAMTIALARRVNSSDGEFLGVVVGVLALDYFQNLYASLQIEENGGAITLWRTDGILVARHPPIDGVGTTFNTVLFNTVIPSSTVQTFEVDNSMGGTEPIPRVLAVKTVKDFPLALTVSFDRGLVLTGWVKTTGMLAAACALLTALGMVLMVVIIRRFSDYEKTNRAIAGEHRAVLDKQELEDQLRQSQKLEAIGQLTAGIAHDFNNLLQVVVGNLEITRRRLLSGPDLDMALKASNAAMLAAQKAATLTHPLLAFAKAQPLNPSHINGRRLMDDVAKLLSRTLGEQIEIHSEIEDGVWPIYADYNLLESVLLNLAINARDAMYGKGGLLTLVMKNVRLNGPKAAAGLLTGEFVEISVTDDGVGMAPEVLRKAFDPFFTTKEVGKGSGLGLSQVYGFANQSGGKAWIESTLGEGTTVTILLPRSSMEDVVEDVGTDETVEPGAIVDLARGHGETILIVDDNYALREFAMHALRDLGYEPVEAADASDAMKAIRAGQIDLMLTDVGLPHMEGPDLAKHARGVRPDLPVIFMTGYPQADVVVDGRLAPDDDVLYKPFKNADLAKAISGVLAREKAA